MRSKICYRNSTLVWSRCLFTRAIWRCIFFQSRAVNTSPIHTHQPKRGFMLWFRAPEGNRPFLKPLLQKDCRKQKQTCLLTCFENDFLPFHCLELLTAPCSNWISNYRFSMHIHLGYNFLQIPLLKAHLKNSLLIY